MQINKFFLTIIFLSFLILCLSACGGPKNRKTMFGHVFKVKPPAENTVMVGVLPIQNATFHPIRITGHKNRIAQFLDEFLKRSLKFNYSEDDIEYVQKSLQAIATQRLYNKGFRVLEPEEIYRIFAQLGLRNMDREMSVEKLTQSVPADWILLITLTMWESDNFDYTGKGKFSFQAVVVDTRLKEAICQYSGENVRFKAPKKSLPYNRQGGETLNEIVKIILREFPKLETVEAYKIERQNLSVEIQEK